MVVNGEKDFKSRIGSCFKLSCSIIDSFVLMQDDTDFSISYHSNATVILIVLFSFNKDEKAGCFVNFLNFFFYFVNVLSSSESSI